MNKRMKETNIPHSSTTLYRSEHDLWLYAFRFNFFIFIWIQVFCFLRQGKQISECVFVLIHNPRSIATVFWLTKIIFFPFFSLWPPIFSTIITLYATRQSYYYPISHCSPKWRNELLCKWWAGKYFEYVGVHIQRTQNGIERNGNCLLKYMPECLASWQFQWR